MADAVPVLQSALLRSNELDSSTDSVDTAVVFEEISDK